MDTTADNSGVMGYSRMARLPIPGGDAGDWGEILNDFLRQEHNDDGSLKDVVRPTDLNDKVGTTGDETISGVKTFAANPIVPAPTEDNQAASKSYVDLAAASGHFTVRPGFWITATSAGLAATQSIQPFGSGSLRLTPIVLREAMPINAVGIPIRTPGDGIVRLGLFVADPIAGTITTIADGGTVSVATEGLKVAEIAVDLLPGMYWVGAVSDVALQVRTHSTAGVISMGSMGVYSLDAAGGQEQVALAGNVIDPSSPFADTIPISGYGVNQQVPMLGMRRAS